MEMSNLQPAEGSVKSDNFRRGRGHGSGNGKTVVLPDNDATKGQIRLINHLVKVEEV